MTIVISYKRKSLPVLLKLLEPVGVRPEFINERDFVVLVSTTNPKLVPQIRNHGFVMNITYP